jgi:Asp/Glu/hydantoin racemase
MDYKTDIAKYTGSINDKAVDAIVKFCGIALQSRDASLVSCTDEAEVDRIRKGFATKVLGLDAAESDKIIKSICEKMKADKTKHRVTFYYLMAEAAGKVDAIA